MTFVKGSYLILIHTQSNTNNVLVFIEVFGCFCPGIELCKSQDMLGIHIPTSGYRNNLARKK